jgi:predicted adenine nucleotide alpha hydrolase (AANH) superfamily ATPase
MKQLLVHCCCAHCSAYTINHWRNEDYEVTALWYNPNIYPYAEHQHRLEAMQSLAEIMDFSLRVINGCDITKYFRNVDGDEANRCQHCFQLRLRKAAETALKNGFNAFTTSLLISPHQKHDLLMKTGQLLAYETGLSFLYADLRKRYSDSRHITKPLDLYRQQYCGCIYSKRERYVSTNRA